MTGARELLPVVQGLRKRGVNQTVDILGGGNIEALLLAEITEFGGRFRLQGSVEFETVPVRRMRAKALVYLSCHCQSDPGLHLPEGDGLRSSGDWL